MDRSKLISKIEKCLRLGKSSEPHEAAAALRQARKLMELHGVSEKELGTIGFGHEKVNVPIQVNKKLPVVLVALVNIIKKAFGVEPVVESEVRVSDRSYVIRYFGPNDRVLLATYSHQVVFRAMNQAWTSHLEENPGIKGGRGTRAGFMLGWLDSVLEQIETLAMTDEEREGTTLVKTNHYNRELRKSKVSNIRISGMAEDSGRQAGSQFRLHRPMGQENLKLTR